MCVYVLHLSTHLYLIENRSTICDKFDKIKAAKCKYILFIKAYRKDTFVPNNKFSDFIDNKPQLE